MNPRAACRSAWPGCSGSRRPDSDSRPTRRRRRRRGRPASESLSSCATPASDTGQHPPESFTISEIGRAAGQAAAGLRSESVGHNTDARLMLFLPVWQIIW